MEIAVAVGLGITVLLGSVAVMNRVYNGEWGLTILERQGDGIVSKNVEEGEQEPSGIGQEADKTGESSSDIGKSDYVDFLLNKTLEEATRILGEPNDGDPQWVKDGTRITVDTEYEGAPIYAVIIEFDHNDKNLSSLLEIAGITRALPETIEYSPDFTQHPRSPWADYSSWIWGFPNTYYGSVAVVVSKENEDDNMFSVRVDVKTVNAALVDLADDVVIELKWYQRDNGSYPSTNNEWKSLGDDPEALEFAQATANLDGELSYSESFKYKSDGTNYELTVSLPNREYPKCVWNGQRCVHRIRNGRVTSLQEILMEEDNFSFNILGTWQKVGSAGFSDNSYIYEYEDKNDTGLGSDLDFELMIIEADSIESFSEDVQIGFIDYIDFSHLLDIKTFPGIALWTLGKDADNNGYSVVDRTGFCPNGEEGTTYKAGEFSLICSYPFFFAVPEDASATLSNGNSYIIWLMNNFIGDELTAEEKDMVEDLMVTISNSFSIR